MKAANKLKNATTESKGKAGRVKRLQERMSARKEAGKKTGNLQKSQIGTAKKSLKSGIQKRMNKKS